MALDTTLFKHLLNVKGTVVEEIEFFHETPSNHAVSGKPAKQQLSGVVA